ncbi:MAG TPA: phage tail protein I, partial [Pyrinomonadaceae bacterium]|nr:phage tail protein I [Pyrinomonadaceae bacterium]
MNALATNENRLGGFLYLNRDNWWSGFRWRGLEIRRDGALQLCSLPRFEGDPLPRFIPDGPAGIARDEDGNIYISDPLNHRLLKIGCDGLLTPVGCVGEEGWLPAQLHTPRGLFIPKYRKTIFVADSANHRVQLFDLASGQPVDSLGQPNISEEPRPGFAPGRFDTPWALTGDDPGNLYVVDYGNRRVQKFNRLGEVVPEFWNTIVDAFYLSQPSDIAAYSPSLDQTSVYIVDANARAVFVVDAHGNPLRDAQGRPLSIGAGQLKKPMGIAATADAIYVGDNERQRILRFSPVDGSFIGEAVGYEGPVSALAVGDAGNLLVHTGSATLPLKLAISASHRTRGVLWSEAISASAAGVAWHRVEAICGELPEGVHLRLFFHTSDNSNDQPNVNPDDDSQPFSDPKWKPITTNPDPFLDSHDLFIGGGPKRYLWIGALFLSDGRNTPTVSQILLEFDHEGYLAQLPALYQTDPISRDFLLRFLALTETVFADLETKIARLPALFDPRATPKEFVRWLATWLGLDLDDRWDEQQKRRLIATAFERYGRRGTVAGLRESLQLFAGVTGIIQEPILNAGWWALPAAATTCGCGCNRNRPQLPPWQNTENSVLGATTMLAASQPQGAVLGSTATLDYSTLITNEEFGSPLFEDVAHQFTVQVYQSALTCPEMMSQVREVLDREKPAHTDYHLCVIRPRMRVGFQASVG